jgi:hypothetical protein
MRASRTCCPSGPLAEWFRSAAPWERRGVRMPATGLCCAHGRLTMADSFLPQSGR